jgi:hypothetical protein
MNDEKKDELQSRRQFFKKAAKGALPILGAIALANMPMLASASETRMGCYGSGCSSGCSYGCANTCVGGCDGSCAGGCHTGCLQGCYQGCRMSCEGSAR